MKNLSAIPRMKRILKKLTMVVILLAGLLGLHVAAIGQIIVPPGYTVETFATGVPFPIYLRFGPGGDLFVANGDNSTPGVQVSKVTPAGAVSPFGGIIPDPDVVLIDGMTGNVFVGSGDGEGKIFQITSNGSVTSVFASGGGLGNVNGMVFDGLGNILSSDFAGGTISLINPAGVVSTFTPGGLSGPAGLIFRPAGSLLVTQENTGTIARLSAAGVILDPAFATGLSDPIDLAFGPSGVFGTDLYVTEGASGEISIVNSAGTVTTFASGLSGPTGLAFGPDGNLYVSEYSNGRILRIRPSASCVSAPSGLLSWWPGDGNADDIKASNHGTLVNGATFEAGKVGQAFEFDGLDDYVEVPFNSNLNIQNAITLDAWVMRKGACTNNCIIVMKQNGIGPCSDLFRYALLIYGTVGVAPGKVTFAFNTGTWDDVVISNTVLQDNVWYHVAGTYDGSGAKIYVNGVLDNTVQKTGTILASTSGPLFIGHDQGGFGSAEFFNGLIDEVEIFNRALTAQEIADIYNAGSAGKCKECTPPEVSITGDDPVCPNSTHTYTANTDATNPTFEWSVTGGTINSGNTGSSISVTAGGAGTMAVSVEVTDGVTSCSHSATLEVSVEDHEPPVIVTFSAPHILWPPNHQYETFLVAQCVDTVADNCALLSPSDVVVDSVSSDEPDDVNGGGDGNTLNDIVIASDCKSVQLRSERQGGGNGRVYTLYLSVRDASGNIGAATCFVTVPHSQNGNPAVDNGPAYFVFGNCNSAPKAAENSDQMSESETLPEGYALEQNYPNPFNPSTSIAFSVKEAGLVQLSIYNLHGQEVRMLASGNYASGKYAITWDGKDDHGQILPSGVYLYKLRVNGFAQTRKMIFMK